jgi:hypothetical protein
MTFIRAGLGAILFSSLAGILYADAVVDVSHEWDTHASSSPAAERIYQPIKKSTESAVVLPELPCDCPTMTPQEHLDESTYAFMGRVYEASSVKKGKRTIAFDTDEIFKGAPPAEMKVSVEVTGDGCDLPFQEGQSYLVFAKWEWGNVTTSRCMGTKLLEKARVEALGPSEQLKEKLYIRLRNACMGRYDTPCCLSSLKAMRVGYYVPEPDDGCPEGMAPDRLHCAGSYTWCIPFAEKGHR